MGADPGWSAAELPAYTPIDARETRRVACMAGDWPIVAGVSDHSGGDRPQQDSDRGLLGTACQCP